jgi:hypothetical protein
MELLKKDLIFLDQDIKSRDDVFAFIAKQAKDKNIITSEDALVAGFKNVNLKELLVSRMVLQSRMHALRKPKKLPLLLFALKKELIENQSMANQQK